jgi:predicted TIM-barrel fold metal-dependent hydrolase
MLGLNTRRRVTARIPFSIHCGVGHVMTEGAVCSGRNKVMFGTNWPMIAPKKALEGLDTLGLDQETHDLFLAGNAVNVFKLDVKQ